MNQNKIENLFDLLATAYYAENYQECISYANRLIEVAPKDEINQYRRANAWLYKGLSAIKSSVPFISNNVNEAIICLKKAIEEDEDDISNYEIGELGTEITNFSSTLGLEFFNASLNQSTNPKTLDKYYDIMPDIINGLEVIIDLLQDEEHKTNYKQHLLLSLKDICNVTNFYNGYNMTYHGLDISDKEKYLRRFDELLAEGVTEARPFNSDFITHFLPIEIDRKGIFEYQLEESTRKSQTTNSGGCYIATAVYGDYDAPEVIVLRKFRDNVLAQSILGRLFIKTYYFFSPPIAQRLKNYKHINQMTKLLLDRFVSKLQNSKRF